MNRSQSPVVGEFAYMLPLCSVNASGVTTMASLKPGAAASRSPLSCRLAKRAVNMSSRTP